MSDLWPLLNAIDAKMAECAALGPVAPPLRRRLDGQLDALATYHSNAVHGAALSEADTGRALRGELRKDTDRAKVLEAVNYRDCLRRVREWGDDLRVVTAADVLDLHALLFRGQGQTHAGGLRTVSERSGECYRTLPSPGQLANMLNNWLEDFNRSSSVHPVIRAAEVHYRFFLMYPFDNGNGRMARLLTDLMLQRYGYAPAIVEVGERSTYYSAIEHAHLGEYQPFFDLLVRAADRGAAAQLAVLRAGAAPTRQ